MQKPLFFMVFHGFFNVYRTIAPTKRGASPIHVTTIRAGGSGIAMSRAAARGRAAQSYPEINVAISRCSTVVPPLLAVLALGAGTCKVTGNLFCTGVLRFARCRACCGTLQSAWKLVLLMCFVF